MNFFFISM